MRKLTFYIGLNDKDKKVQVVNTLDAYRITMNIFGVDATIKECKGVYTHQDGTVTFENTLEVVLLDFDNTLTKEWAIAKANAIKIALNQESVAYQEEDIKSELL